ncbi:hypothetical protein P0D69_27990 [Paraburkholderia sediminicola]|uniref:hypothetical protein n=1 Tax=Paraburkholderia sediminicola TaxID=458836 RepID=UPI0038B87D61
MDIMKFEAELEQTRVLTSKLMAENIKLQREARWIPWIASSVILGAVLGLAKLIAVWFH